MCKQILKNELFADISPDEQELVKGGQFVGSGGYTSLRVLGGGYGYPNFGYGGYGYPGYGGYSFQVLVTIRVIVVLTSLLVLLAVTSN